MEQDSGNTQLQPWGKTIGLLTGCLTIVAGILRSVEPAEIVIRAFVASLMIGGVVRGFIKLVALLTPHTENS